MVFDFREHRLGDRDGFDAEGVLNTDDAFLSTDDADEGFDGQLDRLTVAGHGLSLVYI